MLLFNAPFGREYQDMYCILSGVSSVVIRINDIIAGCNVPNLTEFGGLTEIQSYISLDRNGINAVTGFASPSTSI
jgi:hypothetical protein